MALLHDSVFVTKRKTACFFQEHCVSEGTYKLSNITEDSVDPAKVLSRFTLQVKSEKDSTSMIIAILFVFFFSSLLFECELS